MHWAFKIAKEIIQRQPDLPLYTVACGMTPSGSVHIGNYREFITNYYVAKALQSIGKSVRMIFSWDDYDRFRKVPKNITTPNFEQHIGKPVCAVPNPFNENANESYGKHFENEFEAMLREFHNSEIPVEFIYQSQKYTSGIYNKQIIHAIKHRKQIYDIIISFKTQDEDEGERENYYPISIYCPTCNKDFTSVISFDDKTNIIEYKCKCDETIHHQDVNTANNIKLVWKIDWPMRWKFENVVFEAAGIDHHSENGSFSIGRRIAREIFNYPEPQTCVYAWVGIKGVSSGNMSSSSGINITPAQLLNVYEPEIIRWLFAKYHHADTFDFGFDDIVSRHYMEFDRNLKAHMENTSQDYERAYMDLALFEKPIHKTSFQTISTIAPIAAFDLKKTTEIIKRTGGDFDKTSHHRFEKAKFWLENYMPEKIYKLLPSFNTEYYSALSNIEKEIISKLHSFLSKDSHTETETQQFLYSIINDQTLTKKENIARQQHFFTIFYNLLFGTNQGPRLYLYLVAAQRNEILKLLQNY